MEKAGLDLLALNIGRSVIQYLQDNNLEITPMKNHEEKENPATPEPVKTDPTSPANPPVAVGEPAGGQSEPATPEPTEPTSTSDATPEPAPGTGDNPAGGTPYLQTKKRT